MLPTDRLAEKIFKNLVHDLRQPLGTIETSAYLLNRALRDADGQANPHVSIIERQIDAAVRMLNDAVMEMRLLHAREVAQSQRTEELVLAKSAAAGVG